MSVFTSSPYSLDEGEYIYFTVEAINAVGDSLASAINTDSAVVMTVPEKPALPTRVSSTTSTITIDFDGFTSANNGGSSITSIILYWDQGSGTFVELVGETSDSLVTRFTVTGLTVGSNYSFKYAGKNIFGTGDFSDPASFTAGEKPSKVTGIQTQNSASNVVITWDQPSDNGDDIDSYTITIETNVADTYAEKTATCDGSLTGVITSRTCTFTLAELQLAPYSLT